MYSLEYFMAMSDSLEQTLMISFCLHCERGFPLLLNALHRASVRNHVVHIQSFLPRVMMFFAYHCHCRYSDVATCTWKAWLGCLHHLQKLGRGTLPATNRPKLMGLKLMSCNMLFLGVGMVGEREANDRLTDLLAVLGAIIS